MTDPLRLALIADIHHGPFDDGKDGPSALPLLETVLEEIEALRPALLVDLGDRITETDPMGDLVRFQEVGERFRGLTVPWIYLPGNHDLVNLSLVECSRLLGVPLRPHSIDLAGWHLVFWQIDCRQQPRGRRVSREDLHWLEADLQSTDLPALLFTHVPVDSASMLGNYYFERGRPGGPAYLNSAEVRAVLERTERTVLVVAGHVHWNSLTTIDGIRYTTIQSLTETFTTHPQPAAAWGILDLMPTGMRLEIKGRDNAIFDVSLKPRGHHWLRRPPGPAMPPARHAPGPSSDDGESLKDVKGVILDLDGVVYSGSELLPGVREFITFLNKTGRRVVAATNHSGLTPQGYARKLSSLGVSIPMERVITSARATAQYLRGKSEEPRVFVLGAEGLHEELRRAGCIEVEPPQFVVVGFDHSIDMPQLTQAVRHLLGGASLVGTNADALLPTPDGPVPECGPLLAYLEAATGARATVVGKPNPFFVEQALRQLELPKQSVLMVGDTVATDIAAGLAAGIRTALVLTGNTKQAPEGPGRPTVVVRDLPELQRVLSAELS